MGKNVKRKEIKNLVLKFKVDMCCIQETKLENMETKICRSLWGERKIDWACRDSEERSGGILTVWDDDVFCKTSCWHIRGALIVNCFLRKDGTTCCIVNIYAPCGTQEKFELWDSIK